MEKGEGRKSRGLADLGPRAGLPARRLSPATDRILELVRGQGRPLDLAELAELAELHPNTVREHVDTLLRAGLVTRSRARPVGRGRPAWLYEAAPAGTGPSEYVGLATALSAAMLRVSPDPRHDAALAGEDWGRELARQRGAAPVTPEAAREHAVAILDDLGFAPRRDDPGDPSRVRLTRCPLLDAARQHPRVVCNVHLGILRGVLAEYGADPTGSDLVPFSEPGSCLLVIPPVPARRD